MSKPDHPNEPGRWTLLESGPDRSLWRRDRDDPYPVAMFYIIAPPAQTQVVYEEDRARSLFGAPASVPSARTG